jgi:hypothetical protein
MFRMLIMNLAKQMEQQLQEQGTCGGELVGNNQN